MDEKEKAIQRLIQTLNTSKPRVPSEYPRRIPKGPVTGPVGHLFYQDYLDSIEKAQTNGDKS